MRKNPIILHLILDGYNPSNHDDFFNDFEGIVPSEYATGKFIRDVDLSEGKLRSPDQWTKCYSKTSFAEVHQEGDSGRLGVSSKISRVPAENFLWNKLANKKVKSWLYPFGHYYRQVERNFLDRNPEYVSGFLKMYGTRLGCMLDYGKPTWHKSPISVYYGWHESSWNRESKTTDVFNDYRDSWKNPTEEFIARVPGEVHDYYLDRMTYYRDMDERLFYEEILPHLQQHIDAGDFNDGGYIHIGLVETDTPYHFIPEYPDIVEMIRNYCNKIISKSIDMINPDILIITGDHGMSPVTPEEFSNAKLLDYSKYSGNKRYGAQSSWGITPILTEHSHDVGCMMFAKNPDEIKKFHDEYYERDRYLMYDIYNFIHDSYEGVNDEE